METAYDMLLVEARDQWILRISATGEDWKQLLDTPEKALLVMRHYKTLIEAAQFPSSEFWRLN